MKTKIEVEIKKIDVKHGELKMEGKTKIKITGNIKQLLKAIMK